MAEWSMAVVLKTTVPARVPGVRIPLPPPSLKLQDVVVLGKLLSCEGRRPSMAQVGVDLPLC